MFPSTITSSFRGSIGSEVQRVSYMVDLQICTFADIGAEAMVWTCKKGYVVAILDADQPSGYVVISTRVLEAECQT